MFTSLHFLQGEAELKRQIEVFEQEKKLMTTVAVADNDVLNLNTGGTLLATKRSTLTQVCAQPLLSLKLCSCVIACATMLAIRSW